MWLRPVILTFNQLSSNLKMVLVLTKTARGVPRILTGNEFHLFGIQEISLPMLPVVQLYLIYQKQKHWRSLIQRNTSEFQFRGGLGVFLVAPNEALIHPLVLSADRAYHEDQRSQQSDPRVLRGQYRHTVVQPLDALDRITLHRAIHSG